MIKIVTTFSFLLFGLLFFPLFQKAEARIVVKPNEVGIGTIQTFTVSVLNEKDQPVTGLRLTLPAGLEHVTPTTKNGWTITVDSPAGGNGEVVKEIEWTDGIIPVGQRDEFSFDAKVPDKTATLLWRTYQTYEDGTIVSWDKEPKKHDEEEKGNSGPYSSTLIVDDLQLPKTKSVAESTSNLSLILSMVVIVIAALAFIRSIRK